MPKEVNIFEDGIRSLQLKSGNVVVLQRCDNKVALMVIVDTVIGQMAIEQYESTDTVNTATVTGGNYCFLDREKFPDTLGIDTDLGMKVLAVFPHLGIIGEEETVMKAIHYNDKGELEVYI